MQYGVSPPAMNGAAHSTRSNWQGRQAQQRLPVVETLQVPLQPCRSRLATYLQLAAVELDETPIWEEQSPPHKGCGQRTAALGESVRQQQRLPCSLCDGCAVWRCAPCCGAGRADLQHRVCEIDKTCDRAQGLDVDCKGSGQQQHLPSCLGSGWCGLGACTMLWGWSCKAAAHTGLGLTKAWGYAQGLDVSCIGAGQQQHPASRLGTRAQSGNVQPHQVICTAHQPWRDKQLQTVPWG